jgi:type VI secretion system protein ImpL
MDLLIQRISERMAERLQDEPDLRSRAILFGFPAQLGAIKKPIADFLNRIFEPTRYQTTTTLRGFYFTSGAQEGTPFDTLIGALQKSYGVESLGAIGFSGVGKSYFLHDLMAKLVFGEAGWVSINIAAVRRSFALRGATFSAIALATLGILGLWWMSYVRNDALIAATQRGVADYSAAAGALIKQRSVTDPSLEPIYELIGVLPYLPVGYARRNDATPIEQTFGLSQRSRLQDSSNQLYQQALERLMRPRLILSLERQIQKNVDDPTFTYEALKVYLMLGHNAPSVNKDLIVSWFARDWEERVFPGASNAGARALLRSHLEAMLDMDKGGPIKVSLNGPLVEQAQATLARMRVAERAYTLLKSEAHNDGVEDWVASQHGGPDMTLVFEAANGTNLDNVRVPGFFTYDGFAISVLGHMQTIADKLQKENWVLGASGDQGVVKQQYVSLFPGILELYSRDFIAAWTSAINNLQLKPLLNDKPKYVKLSAASAPTSPILLIFESVRNETALTRERPKPPQGNAADQVKQDALKAANRLTTAIDLAMKSQRKAGDPPAEVPGASIEAYFKPYQIMVDGPPGSRPIDALIANLNELYRQLVLAAGNPAQARQALGQVDVQVASLRANATRLPQPLAGMADKVAKDAAGDANASSLAQIADAMAQDVTGSCQQLIANRYPFTKSDRDVPMADFAKLFAPGGTIDRFFSANLEPLVNRSGKTWVWKPNPNLSRKLSDTTLRQFQQAAEIRDAFFPTGGNAPSITMEVKPLTLSSDAQTATLTINGANVVNQLGANNAAANVQWPGAGAGDASIAMAPEMPDRKSSLERTGAWALFRLIDAGSSIQSGNAFKVSFVVFGREASFEFTSSSLTNPLSMPSLRQFKCPNGL